MLARRCDRSPGAPSLQRACVVRVYTSPVVAIGPCVSPTSRGSTDAPCVRTGRTRPLGAPSFQTTWVVLACTRCARSLERRALPSDTRLCSGALELNARVDAEAGGPDRAAFRGRQYMRPRLNILHNLGARVYMCKGSSPTDPTIRLVLCTVGGVGARD